MMEKYSDGVLDEKFINIEDKMEAHFDAQNQTLIRIESQTTKTNGRVKWLEKMIWLAVGALAPLTFWSIWLTNETLKSKEELSPIQNQAIQAAVLAGILEATKQYAK